MPTVLNVGSGYLAEIPPHFSGWEHIRLDINPDCGADLVCDARQLHERVAPASYDAVYCCHNLEHYHPHEGELVLRGFAHVLRPYGFTEIRVPDIGEILEFVVQRGLDVEDELYMSPGGSIRVVDALHGWQAQIAQSGNDFYAHKMSFTWKALVRVLAQAGFTAIYRLPPIALFELRVVAFKQAPGEAQRRVFGIAN